MPNYWTKTNLARIAAGFDEQWYTATYYRDLADLKRPGESPLDFYLRVGGRMGHDPNHAFSELFFRTANPKVYAHLLAHPRDFGYLLFQAGFREKFFLKPKTATPTQGENWRQLILALDTSYIAATNSIDHKEYVSVADFYLRRSRSEPISPSADFSEERYRAAYPDVNDAIGSGNMLSGYHHYVIYGKAEGRPTVSVAEYEAERKADEARERKVPGTIARRKQLEGTIPGITNAVEFGFIREIDYLTDPVTIRRRGRGGRGFLVFMPYYFPEIFFGGYLAFFDFLKAVKRVEECELKLVVVRKLRAADQLQSNIERIRLSSPDIAELFSGFHLLQESRTIEAGGDYGVISFCAETHFVASEAAKQLNVTPIFVVQDYEPDFHPAGTLKTFVRSSFDLPHIGIYNSRKLYEYFRDETDIKQISHGNYRCATFENIIEPMPWDWETFKSRHAAGGKRRLIVYARPEFLGSRNEFAIIVTALRMAIRRGHLDETKWEFYGVGSLIAHDAIRLSRRSEMSMMPKMPLATYQDFILSGDVGISLISTPHPGIIHFQMAAYGLAAVTYAMKGRTAEWLRNQSRNIVPSPATIEGLCEAIAQAAALSGRLEERYENALKSVVHPSSDDLEQAARLILNQQAPMPLQQ